MMKTVLIAGVAMMSAPLLAQQTSTVPQAAANTGTATATTPEAQKGMSAQTPAPRSATAATQAMDAADDAPATGAPAQSAAAQPATTQPATTGDQVAQIVDSEFPSYDKAGKGSLTKEEFGTWMVALRSASDPSANAASPEMKTWVAQAFTSADADRSGSVSKDELTSFLSQGKS